MQKNPNLDHREQVRNKIITAALAAFRKKGIKAMRMDDLSHHLGISKRTLYEIFDDKEMLLFECVRYYHTQQRQKLIALTQSAGSVMEILLHSYLLKVEEFRTTSPSFYADMVKYPDILHFLEQENLKTRDAFIGFLSRGVSEGYFRSDVDFNLSARLFDSLGHYIMEHRLYEQYSIEALIHNLVFVTLRGLCTPKGITALDTIIASH